MILLPCRDQAIDADLDRRFEDCFIFNQIWDRECDLLKLDWVPHIQSLIRNDIKSLEYMIDFVRASIRENLVELDLVVFKSLSDLQKPIDDDHHDLPH